MVRTKPARKVRTRGQATLAKALDARAITQAEVVEAVGAAQSSVSNWATGEGRPDACQREALRRCFGIPLAWWFTEDERARLGRMRQRAVLASIRHAQSISRPMETRKVNGRRPVGCSEGRA